MQAECLKVQKIGIKNGIKNGNIFKPIVKLS